MNINISAASVRASERGVPANTPDGWQAVVKYEWLSILERNFNSSDFPSSPPRLKRRYF